MSANNPACDALSRAQALFNDYTRSVHLISQHPTIRRCGSLSKLVNPDWYERVYLPKQPNIHLVRNKKLPGDLLGLVVRRDIEWQGKERGIFLIQVAPQINSIAEHFVIAHELGHVLAHGRLMYAGMVVSEAAWERRDDEDDRRQLVELEANVCALMSIVPHMAIQALTLALGRPVDARSLQSAMHWLLGEPFDSQLAQERLLLSQTIAGTVTIDDFVRVVCTPARSWTLDGAAAHGVGDSDDYAVQLPRSVLKAWLAQLCEYRIVSFEDWPRARDLLRSSQLSRENSSAAPRP